MKKRIFSLILLGGLVFFGVSNLNIEEAEAQSPCCQKNALYKKIKSPGCLSVAWDCTVGDPVGDGPVSQGY